MIGMNGKSMEFSLLFLVHLNVHELTLIDTPSVLVTIKLKTVILFVRNGVIFLRETFPSLHSPGHSLLLEGK